MRPHEIQRKVEIVVDSCKTPEQLEGAIRYAKLWMAMLVRVYNEYPHRELLQYYDKTRGLIQDMNNDQEPADFNSWYNSDETQERVKKCSIPAVIKSICGWCGEKRVLNENGSCKCCACLDDEQTVL